MDRDLRYWLTGEGDWDILAGSAGWVRGGLGYFGGVGGLGKAGRVGGLRMMLRAQDGDRGF